MTMALASLPGKLEEYVDLERDGLTAIELDIKDENGEVGFADGAPALARKVGAVRDFYSAKDAAKLVHGRGLYLIGRIVVFEDPLSHTRPDLAVLRSSGSYGETAPGSAGRTRTTGGSGTTTSTSPKLRAWRIRRDHVRLRAVPLRR